LITIGECDASASKARRSTVECPASAWRFSAASSLEGGGGPISPSPIARLDAAFIREATEDAMLDRSGNGLNSTRRRHFIGGSDARIIMGDDEAALLRLWQEKRGEVEPEDLSGNLIVQNGPTSAYLRLLTESGFRRRTPGPPPSWSMNSTPADSSARRITSRVARHG